MHCAACGCAHPDATTSVCSRCGAPLARACPACGQTVAADARYCSACGGLLPARPAIPAAATGPAPLEYTPAHLAERILDAQAALAARGGASDGERKTVTALFADLASSTALIHALDPEDARRLLDPVLELMMEAVHHYEGYVTKLLGDGLLALFGAPIAHEDHACRALYAALRMQEAMRRYADGLRAGQGVALALRVGVNTGEVIVRAIRTDDLRTDYDPVGPTIHLASRLEGIALPGSVIASASTHRLAQGWFTFRALGATPVRGLPEPLPVYELLGPGALRTRLQLMASRGLAAFVGRRAELERLARVWAGVGTAAGGALVALAGEPGVGKSRLLHEFRLGAVPAAQVLETGPVAHGKAWPWLPLIELLTDYAHIDAGDDARTRGGKLSSRVLALDPALDAELPWLLHLLGLDAGLPALAQMDPQSLRQRLFEALARLLRRLARERPLLLIVEDLQWLDADTEAWLAWLAPRLASLPVLLLVDYRPEYRDDWLVAAGALRLRLEALGTTEAGALLDTLLGPAAELAALRAGLLERTDGNPFYLEEVVQTLAGEGVLAGARGNYRLAAAAGAARLAHLPPTVQGVLAARIDRLDAADKALLQTLAVIGRHLPWSLIARVTAQPEALLKLRLARLQAGEFIHALPAWPETGYRFRHALTQEVAYGSLPGGRRAALHVQTAQAIEALYPERLDEHCAELATHYRLGGDAPRAIDWLLRAGLQARRRAASVEAESHLDAALALTLVQPPGPARDRRELELQLALGSVRMLTQGYAAPGVEQAYLRTLALIETLDEPAGLFPALFGLRTLCHVRGELVRAQALGARLLELAQRSGDAGLLIEAHRAYGASLFNRGELRAALGHMTRTLALHDPHAHRGHGLVYGVDAGVLGHAFTGWLRWHLGEPDAARREALHALELARADGLAHVEASALVFAAEVHQHCGDRPRTRALAEAAIALADEHGFPLWSAWGGLLRGWALAAGGETDAGIAAMQAGLIAYARHGAALWRPHFLELLAETCLHAGRLVEARAILDEARTVIATHDERVYASELWRLDGELILAEAGPGPLSPVPADAAATCLHTALAHAQACESVAMALRAAVALARLHVRLGRAATACALLRGALAAFDAAADDAGLTDARRLLARLAQPG